jgi:hypothetical protein
VDADTSYHPLYNDTSTITLQRYIEYYQLLPLAELGALAGLPRSVRFAFLPFLLAQCSSILSDAKPDGSHRHWATTGSWLRPSALATT